MTKAGHMIAMPLGSLRRVHPGQSEEPKQAEVKILVCEHGFLDRSELLRILATFGKCDAATSGQECLAAFEAALAAGDPYDLVTIDPELTTADGRILLDSLRSIEASVGVDTRSRVLLTTAGTAQSGADTQCDGRLTKRASATEIGLRLADLGFRDR